MPTAVTILDVDRTLTRRPTYSAFLIYAVLHRAPWRLALLPMLIPVAIAYAAKRISRRRMKEAMHRVALGRRLERRHAIDLGDRFAADLFHKGVYADAFATIAAERAQGRLVVLATAAPELYIAPLARLLGIDDVLASQSTWEGDHLRPEMIGENCYGSEKLSRIGTWLNARGIERKDIHVRFLSDHASDLPTFRWADEPVMVNASAKLAKLGNRHGWRSLDWTSS